MPKRTDIKDWMSQLPVRRRGEARVVFRGPESQQSWSGIGPCPRWLEQLIDAGRDPAEFLVPGARLPPAFAKAPAVGASHAVATFRCPKTGNTWTGRGYQPPWFRASLKAGITPKDLLAPGAVLPARFRTDMTSNPVSKKAARVPTKQTSPTRKKVVFISPDRKESWNGRGAPPHWFSDYVRQKGQTPSQLLARDAVLPARFAQDALQAASSGLHQDNAQRGTSSTRKKSVRYQPR